jgi:hypothetical protein
VLNEVKKSENRGSVFFECERKTHRHKLRDILSFLAGGSASDTYDLIVTNSVGSDTETGGFIIE